LRYEEHQPPAALAPFVECLWLARDDAPTPRREPSDAPEAIVPDGCIEWIFHLASPYRRIHAGGASEVQPASVVAGVTTEPLRLAPTGRVATLGVRFRPGGAYPFLRLPLEELTDAIVPTGALWGASGRRLEEEVGNARDADEARGVVEDSLMRRLDPRAPDPRLRAAVGRILRRRGRVTLPEVAAEACWSPRQLEREFRRRVGVSPKTLARIARFQNVLRLSGRSPERAWAEIAADAGYADQAHLIRDFRQFSGTTPSRREEAEGALSRNFVSPERLDTLLGSTA
jgi:AraC-like DNA-binding protein